jgi:hypothetical protein
MPRRRADFRVEFENGIELDITNAHGPGHARSIAIDYLERTGRIPGAILATERLPANPVRHQERVETAKALGRVLPLTCNSAKNRPPSAKDSSRRIGAVTAIG